jgi:2-dehydropantoate 2-reductase
LKTYRLCIIGGGSIGGMLAYYAYRGGVLEIPVYYRTVESVKEVEKNSGLQIMISNKEYLVPVKPIHYEEPMGYCEFIINAVKAYNVKDTIDLMHKLSYSDTLILMIQNGFGSLEVVEEAFPQNHVAGGVVFIGAERIGRSKIKYNGGNTLIAGLRRGFTYKLFELMDIFRRGGCDFRVVSDIDFYRWLKLGVNAVINPLTAITRSPNRVVLTKYGLIIAEKIIEELVLVAKKHGYILNPKKLLEIVKRGAMNTAENYSSMAQDILHSRRTEVDYINGFIAKYLGKPSYNGVITEIIHLIEESTKISHKR